MTGPQTPDRIMQERYAGRADLLEDDAFWVDVSRVYHGGDVALPIEADEYVQRDVADLVQCEPGVCGQCCRRFRRQQVGPRDIQRIREGTGIDISPSLLHEEGTVYLPTGGGCQFLKDNRCTIYRYRPDGCYFFPIQWGHQYDAHGKRADRRLFVRLECWPVVQAVRTIMRRIVEANPGSLLLPNLAIRAGP